MQLYRIAVNGFRNVKTTNIVFDEMISLVSLNSYGKSNLLDAIDFGIDFIKANSEKKNDLMKWHNGIPLNKKMDSSNYSIEFEFIVEFENQLWSIIYGYEFRWEKNDGSGVRIVSEILKTKLDQKNQRYNFLIKRNDDNVLFRTSKNGRCSNKINIGENELVVNKLQAFDNLYYAKIIQIINKLSIYVDRHLDASSSYRPDPLVMKGVDALDLKVIDSLPRVIYHLKKKHLDKYEMLIDAYKQLFPQFSEVTVLQSDVSSKLKKFLTNDLPFTITNEVYALFVKDKNLNQPINFERLSDGAKRVFLLLTSIVLADVSNLILIAIEEPENSIHPSLLQKYLRIVSFLAGDAKIIMTSHSPYLVQYQNPSSIYIGLPNDSGVAQFNRIRKSAQRSLLNDAADENMSIGDYIFDLLSGTKVDFEMIANYLEQDDYE